MDPAVVAGVIAQPDHPLMCSRGLPDRDTNGWFPIGGRTERPFPRPFGDRPTVQSQTGVVHTYTAG